MAVLAQPAEACSCVASGPPCEEFWKPAAVFVGRVVAIEAYRGRADALANRVVRLETLEAFRGVSRSSVVEVTTGSGGGDCGYPFKVGERYVVYAFASNEGPALTTSICTRTRPFADAAGDLSYARAVATSNAGGTVMGTVRHGDHQIRDSQGATEYEPMPGVTVVIDGEGARHRVVTDAAGRFSVAGLPAGSFQASVELPEGQYADVWPRDVNILDARGCAEVNALIHGDGRVSGRVLDSKRKPVPAFTVGLLPFAALGRRALAPDLIEARTDGDGRYSFSKVRAGRYVIGVNLRTGFDGRPVYPRIFYPGVGSEAGAAPVEVREGQRVQVPELVLPAAVRLATVTGRVVTVQGRPAAGASVYLHGETDRTPVLAVPAVADANGRFSIAVIEGYRYSLVAEHPRPLPGKPWNADGGRVPVFTASPSLPPVRIVVRPLPLE